MSKRLKDHFTKGFYPYPKQVEGIRFMLKHHYCIINGKPGVGKTIMATALMCLEGGKSICVVPSSLKTNWKHEIAKYCDKKVKVIKTGRDLDGTDSDWDILIYSYNFVGRIEKYVRQASSVIFDECFRGDVEVFTDKGFKRFDMLGDEKVAQYEDGKIEFVDPLRKIKKRYKGDLIHFNTDKTASTIVTPGHDMLFKVNGVYKKVKAKDVPKDSRFKTVTCGKVEDYDLDFLSPEDRFAIAYQADGSLHGEFSQHNTYSFSFVKDRKVKRLEEIVNSSSLLTMSEVKDRRGRRRFLVKGPKGITKRLRNHFEIGKVSLSYAKEIIEEMVEWDGSKTSETRYYYSSVVEDNTNFYQEVATLAGYKTNKTVQQDKRKNTFKDVHRLFIRKEYQESNTSLWRRDKIPHDGFVYCVTVPSGKIVTRHNGKVLVTGNCHYLCNPEAQRTQNAHEVVWDCKPKRVVLLSGTPIKNRVLEYYSLLALCSYNPKKTSGVDISISYPSYMDFAEQFSYKILMKINGRKVSKYEGTRNVPELKRLLANKMKTIKNVVELPDTQHIDVFVDAGKVDDNLLEDFEAGKGHISTAKSKSALAKANATGDYANDLLKNCDAVVIFTDHVESAHRIHKRLKGSKAVITGAVSIRERDRIIEEFKKGSIDTLVLTIGSASVGYTLVRAKDMIFNDISWVESDNEQARKRIHRVGQDKKVRYHYMLGSKLDERIKLTVERKIRDLKDIV